MPGPGGILQPRAPGLLQGKAMVLPQLTESCTYTEAVEQGVSAIIIECASGPGRERDAIVVDANAVTEIDCLFQESHSTTCLNLNWIQTV